MSLILCATRGGESSYRTQQAAIALAKERGDEILFLYVLNLDFLDKTAAPIVVDIESELAEMGRFFLLMATERAAQQGVSVRTAIRKGAVREEIIQSVAEEDAVLVVLGRPTGKQSAFEMESMEAFAAEIERVTGAETVLV
ncbi:MAG: universal stress protein [Anaerolineales bacterium]|jgi:nucleotide-binding universal stress UspA family protein